MKKIALLLFTVIAISCTRGKHEIETGDIPGQWKTLQEKKSRKTTIHDVNCEEGKTKWNGNIYTFNADGNFSVKDICTEKPDQDTKKTTWKYEDHILTLYYIYKNNKEMKAVYSVSDIGDDKIKWKLLYTRYDYNYTLEDVGYYLIMQKQ